MPTQAQVEEELRSITRGIQQEAQRRSNGRTPEGPEREYHPPQPQGPARESVAEELAKFIEQHAQDLVKEAEQHLHEAKEFADEIRRRADEKAAELRAFLESIKASRSGMEELRTNFLQARTASSDKAP